MSMISKCLLASGLMVASLSLAQAQGYTTPEGNYLPEPGYSGSYGGGYGNYSSGPSYYNRSPRSYGGGYGTYNGGNGPYGSDADYGYAPHYNYGYGGGYGGGYNGRY